jgi:uncharacterized zinc-type alcohol dehydrogenase-like protein
MPNADAYAATSPDAPLSPLAIERREVGPRDVEIEVLYCGVCHSDLHFARGEWRDVDYPVVTGHEIVGKIVSVGDGVDDMAAGDLAGVGCMVDSCRTCSACQEGLEQYCHKGNTQTYGGVEKETGKQTYGGYSSRIVVDRDFVLRISPDVDLAATAPLLCAGITTYSPLRHWGVEKGSKVGVVGLGGLGHMAVKLAHAMGAEVTLFTTSPGKADDARALGADEVVISKDAGAMAAKAGSLDLIVNTVAAQHDLDPLLSALAVDGTMVLVGAPAEPHPSPQVFNLLMARRSLAGSGIGGIAETQEMLDFCAEHGVAADIELIQMEEIDEAWDRMEKGDVKFRFVIDTTTIPAAA